MKKLVLAFFGLVVLSGCVQDKTLTPNTQEVHADQLTFFEAAEAMKQRYFTLSQQLEDGTYAQDDS
jgi:lipoprotein